MLVAEADTETSSLNAAGPPSETEASEPPQFARGVSALVYDGAWASAVGALSSGVVVVGLALGLGASASLIGLLAALPFFAQLAQIPAVGLVERLRRRRSIALRAITTSRVVVLLLAAVPFMPPSVGLWTLVAGQAVIAVLVAVGSCAWNSWIHDFLQRANLGGIFARRMRLATAFGLAASLLASAVLELWPEESRLEAFSALFLLGAWCGFASSAYLARVPDVAMHAPAENALRCARWRRRCGTRTSAASSCSAPPGASPTISPRRSLRCL